MFIKIKNCFFKIIYALTLIYLLTFLPSFFGHKPLVVLSGSMEPVLKVGGILYYHEIDIDSFEVNDILVYKTKHHIISHRVVDKTDTGYITKGDNNRSVDGDEINKSQILGKGTDWSIPYLGYYTNFIYTHKYILFITVAIVFLDLMNDYYIIHKKKVRAINEENF